MSNTFAMALGCGSKNRDEHWLEVFYPDPILNPDSRLIEAVSEEVDYHGGNAALELTYWQIQHLAREWRDAGFERQASYAVAFQESSRPVVLTILENDAEPVSTPETYLKLHLLSHRLVKPGRVVLDDFFPLLPNLAWTNEGAVDLDELPERQLLARLNGTILEVNSVDKFPTMTDYVVPADVRIADSARVRLGAYVGEGTTVMHEGFINFNAGTDIPLGNRCTVEAGLYITFDTKVDVLDENGDVVSTVEARHLAGQPDLLFHHRSASGTVQCQTNKTAVTLNQELHQHS